MYQELSSVTRGHNNRVQKRMRPFFVYILLCRDGSYYTGHTDELEKRLDEHQDGVYPCYTKSRLPVELQFVSECSSRDEAIERERQIKRWSRKKKAALIRQDWDELKRLSACHTRPSTRATRSLRTNGGKGGDFQNRP